MASPQLIWPRQRVLGPPAVVARLVLPPQPGPDRGIGVALEVAEAVVVLAALGVALLVADKRAVGSTPAVGTDKTIGAGVLVDTCAG